MSYSLGVRAATKEAVKAAVRAKFAEIVAGQQCHARDQAAALAGQQCHARDQAAALAAADAQVDLLADDDTKDVVVSMNGSLTGQWSGSDVTRIEGASVSVNAYLATPETAS